MILANDHNQLPLFDPWEFLSPRPRKMFDQFWTESVPSHKYPYVYSQPETGLCSTFCQNQRRCYW